MRHLEVTAPGQIHLAVSDSPAVRTGEVLVTPVMAGLCATDLEIIDGTIDPAYVNYPVTLGHEFVVRVGDDLAVVEGIVPCGDCHECQRGHTNRCAVYDEVGFTRPGALAEALVVPERLVHRLQPSVKVVDAVLCEPLAVTWRGLSHLHPTPGSDCLVIGDGTIGLLSALLLRQFSPASVTVVGRREEQRELAYSVGVDTFLTTDTDARFDVIIEASGHPSAAQQVLHLTRRGAKILLLGLTPHESTVTWHPDDLVNGDITLLGSFGYDQQAFRDVVALLNQGTLTPGSLVTHQFTLDEWERAVATLRHTPAGEARGKVALRIDAR
ncbi:MAG: alcohol dehydrogenase catalytic domain-containing protein [Acidobacteria bacterium]|nr:alcohol dehydrogenase catalytic domain-containing protein [Acidobacteriota bacterium]